MTALTAAATATLLLGCKKPAQSDTHLDSGDAHHDGDGHDHAGHGHTEGEGHTDEVKLTDDAIARYGVKVEAAQLWALRPTLVSPARVSFNLEAMAHVGSPLRGRAVELAAGLGDIVKKDQTLLIVESPELGESQADFLQKRIAAQSASPATDLARLAWERAKALHEQSQGISLSEVQKREAEYRATAAAQRAAEAAAVAAEQRLGVLGMSEDEVRELAASGRVSPRHAVRAPIDGQVVQREVTLGELVNPDREALMVLADTRTLWVLADVPEARLREVAAGAPAWISVAVVGASQLAAARHEGKVALVAPQVDAATRTAPVRIEIPGGTLGLRPGMFVQVEIAATDPASPEPVPVVAVPAEAVQIVEGGPAVFVPVTGEPNTFAKRAVDIGKAIGGLVPVYSGLVEGEAFVSSGSFILKADLGKGSAAHEH